MDTTSVTLDDLPGLDCGLCGFSSCALLAERLRDDPDLAKRCIYLAATTTPVGQAATVSAGAPADTQPTSAGPYADASPCGTCPVAGVTVGQGSTDIAFPTRDENWCDTLGREFDFVLEPFPEDPGPREIILPHNPLLTRELDVQPGDILVGRPLGMSCGCPITHCGVAMQVDQRTGVIVWCVTGPLRPRQEGYKDLVYYIAEGYEGLVQRTRCEIKIGFRYLFKPGRCMLQWRHSGLVNYVSRTPTGLQVRVEGLWIG